MSGLLRRLSSISTNRFLGGEVSAAAGVLLSACGVLVPWMLPFAAPVVVGLGVASGPMLARAVRK